ncbi:MAG: ATP-binding protein [Solirubrobacteraceae bacterium]
MAQSVHGARRFATEALDGAPRRALEAVELLVSELATNCIRHERATFHVTVTRSAAQVRLEVTDGGDGKPRMRSPGPEEPSGRGLQIVDMLSDRWGVAPESPAGKTVWFELDLSQGGAAAAPIATKAGVPGREAFPGDGGGRDRGRVPEPASGAGSRSGVQGLSGRSAASAQGSRPARRYPAHERCRDARRRCPPHRRADAARSH